MLASVIEKTTTFLKNHKAVAYALGAVIIALTAGVIAYKTQTF